MKVERESDMVAINDIHNVEEKVDGAHFDVSGKWGGVKGRVVHVKDGEQEYGYLYRYVGPYWSVGSYPGDYEPSIWSVVDNCAEFVNGERSLWTCIKLLTLYQIKCKGGKVGKALLTIGRLKRGVVNEISSWITSLSQDRYD